MFFYENILKYFNDFRNQNFWVLWQKLTQTMEMKQNQTFFYRTYSNLTPYLFFIKNCKSIWMTFKIEISQFYDYLTPYLFFIKNVKVFEWPSKSKFLSFMTKVSPYNGNETKSDIFPRDIFKSDISFHWL